MTLLSSPGSAVAWEHSRIAEPPSSPILRDNGQLLHDIDRSFGSSRSISSIHSPQSRTFARVAQDFERDQFSPPVSGDQLSPELPWALAERITSRSSPHAMEISSPAVLEDTTAQAIGRMAPSQRYSVPVLRATQGFELHDRSGRTLSVGGVPLCRSDSQSEPSSPAGPPLKKRLSALYRLQKNEAQSEPPLPAPEESHDSNTSQDDSQVSQTSQNVRIC